MSMPENNRERHWLLRYIEMRAPNRHQALEVRVIAILVIHQVTMPPTAHFIIVLVVVIDGHHMSKNEGMLLRAEQIERARLECEACGETGSAPRNT
jgi:hypothetical protein